VNFKEWLIKKYDGRRGPRGDLAYDVGRDDTFPMDAGDYWKSYRERCVDYLRMHGACRECVATFKRAYRDYEKAMTAN